MYLVELPPLYFFWLSTLNWHNTVNWTTALSSANNLASGTCGLTDSSTAGQWRLPNYKELDSLIDLSNFSPALSTGYPFSGVQNSYYWSASSYAGSTTFAWVVHLSGGNVSAGGRTAHVLCLARARRTIETLRLWVI